MDDKELDKLLHQLHDEIEKTHSIDGEGSELLLDLEGDIRKLLERSKVNPLLLHPSVVQRLERALSQFEVTHPDLTTLISNLLDSFSSAGL
jgi:hypothetical protein